MDKEYFSFAIGTNSYEEGCSSAVSKMVSMFLAVASIVLAFPCPQKSIKLFSNCLRRADPLPPP